VGDPVLVRDMVQKSKEKVGEFSREKMLVRIVDVIGKL